MSEPSFLETPVTMDGETHTVEAWCQLRKLKQATVRSRRGRGCTWREALQPVGKRAIGPLLSPRRK